MSLCTRCGWSVDIVRSDYGEDLICQTFLDKEADPFRIFLQVKASSRLKSIRFDKDHLIKWVGSLDFVVIIFWNEDQNEAFYCVPDDIWNLSDLVFSGAKSFSI